MKKEYNSDKTGYSEDFLGNNIKVPLPRISLEHQSDIFESDDLREGFIADFCHYSLIMSKSKKQAFFSAANVNQAEFQASISSRKWFLDSRIGIDFQLGQEVYSHNEWDRGHLTRRADITWGELYEAKNGSLDSCCYANACPQHENFNQDEWTVPEEAVYDFDKDLNDRLCVFTGPVFDEHDRFYTVPGIAPVRIPSGFWKIVSYIGKESGNLECQAYLMYQDAYFNADKRGKLTIKLSNYQVTITEIELLTGLDFNKELFNNNPLYFYPHPGENKTAEGYKTERKTAIGIKDSDGKLIKKGNGVVYKRDDLKNQHIKDNEAHLREEEYFKLLRKGSKKNILYY